MAKLSPVLPVLINYANMKKILNCITIMDKQGLV